MAELLTGPTSRDIALERLSSENFDLLIVGGGITGAGIALDAAARGLRVALVERLDFASGTSSKSSKLIHGGLRYLETRDFALMRESARERDRLRRIAPHLVTPLPFFLPEWSGGKRKAGVGLWIYDFLAGFRNFHRHSRVNDDEAQRFLPAARRKGGGYVYYDSVTDDVRLTLGVLEEARRRGAVRCNHCEVVEFAMGNDRIFGATILDRIGGSTFGIRARQVVNATGIWADRVRTLASPQASERLRPSKGIHIVLPRNALPIDGACLIPAGKRRLFFVVPWRSSLLVGTTDSEYEGSLDEPAAGAEEVGGMLESLSRAFDREFSANDVVGAYAGLRPLLSDEKGTTTRDLSRKHAIYVDPSGLVTITGGKMTTYRKMASDAVDALSLRMAYPSRSPTASIRIRASVKNLPDRASTRANELGLDPEVTQSLIHAYGDDALNVLDLAEEGLDRPVVDGLPYLEAELVWAVRNEMAITIEDVLSRRLRLSLEARGGGLEDDSRVLDLISSELHTSSEEVRRQATLYWERVLHERGPIFRESEELPLRSSD